MIDRLTSWELEMARMISSGMSAKDIADKYGYHHRTINNMLLVIYKKMGYTGGCKNAKLASDYAKYKKDNPVKRYL